MIVRTDRKILARAAPPRSLAGMRLPRLMFLLGLAGLTPFASRANVTPAPLFTDHAVIQCDMPVVIWGSADPGESVTVTFAGQTAGAVADTNGAWEVRLAPIQAGAGGSLVITGKNTVELKDVVAGEVWFCSGQSNMQMNVGSVTNAPAEIAAGTFPLIRQFQVPLKPAKEPQDARFITKAAWKPADTNTVAAFTAAGYFFAREVHRTLNVPVGLINASWGATPIQPWMSLTALQAYPGYQKLLDRKQAEIAAWPQRKAQLDAELKAWETRVAEAKAAGQPAPARPWQPGPPDSGHYMPTQLFNGMVHPVTRYRIRGALWYQGEANAGGGAGGAADYTDLLSRLIADWRRAWDQGDFPFYFAQLPNWDNPGDKTGVSWAFFREGQARVLSVTNTGMAVLIDAGDAADIHPKNKQEAGRRLALQALARTYGRKVVASGPVPVTNRVEGSTLRVVFRGTDQGLVARDKAPLAGFELAGTNGVFFPATATLQKNSVLLRSPEVKRPAFARYLWTNNPAATLFNGAGLPAAPFRTDPFPK